MLNPKLLTRKNVAPKAFTGMISPIWIMKDRLPICDHDSDHCHCEVLMFGCRPMCHPRAAQHVGGDACGSVL